MVNFLIAHLCKLDVIFNIYILEMMKLRRGDLTSYVTETTRHLLMVLVLPTVVLRNTRPWNSTLWWTKSWGSGQACFPGSKVELAWGFQTVKSRESWGREEVQINAIQAVRHKCHLEGAKRRDRPGGGNGLEPSQHSRLWGFRLKLGSWTLAAIPESLKIAAAVLDGTLVALTMSAEDWAQMSDHEFGNVELSLKNYNIQKIQQIKPRNIWTHIMGWK